MDTETRDLSLSRLPDKEILIVAGPVREQCHSVSVQIGIL